MKKEEMSNQKIIAIILSKSLFSIFCITLAIHTLYHSIAYKIITKTTLFLLFFTIMSILSSLFQYKIKDIHRKIHFPLHLLVLLFFSLSLKYYLLVLDHSNMQAIPTALIVSLGFYTWILYAYVVNKICLTYAFPHSHIISKITVPSIIQRFFTLILYCVSIIIALIMETHITTTRILEISGVFTGLFTLAIGFYFKEVITNILHGVLIAISPPFEIDDLVKIGSTFGFVKEYRWRTIKIKAFNNSVIYIPNNQVSNSQITNLTNIRDGEENNFIGNFDIYTHPDHDPGWIRSLLIDAIKRTKPLTGDSYFKVIGVNLNDYDEKGAKFFIVFNTRRTLLYSQINEILINIYRVFADVGVRMTIGNIYSKLSDDSLFFKESELEKGANTVNQNMKKFNSTLNFSKSNEYQDQVSNFEIVKRSHVFGKLNNNIITALAAIGTRKYFSNEQEAIIPGETSSGVHIIRSGVLIILDKEKNELARVSAGQIFGEMSSINDASSEHYVVALTHVTTLFLPIKELNKLLKENPELNSDITRIIKERIDENKKNQKMNLKNKNDIRETILFKATRFFFAV